MPITDFFRLSPREPEKPRKHQAAPSRLIDEKAPSPLAIIYRSELDYISRCVLDYPDIETGGQLFGFWTSQGAPVVLYAIGPGPRANHERSFFNQDEAYLNTVGHALLDRYALQHIGEWHSHHQLGLSRPSGHDAQTMFHGLQRIPQRRLLLCIANYEQGRSSVNPYTFHENDMYHYADALWVVKELESPFRPLADRALDDVLVHPRTLQARHGMQRVAGEPQSAPQQGREEMVRLSNQYWLMRPGNVDRMKHMVALVKERWPSKDVAVQADSQSIVQISVGDGEFAFRFPQEFPYEGPQFLLEGELDEGPEWHVPVGDVGIYEAFREWLSLIDVKLNKITI